MWMEEHGEFVPKKKGMDLGFNKEELRSRLNEMKETIDSYREGVMKPRPS